MFKPKAQDNKKTTASPPQKTKNNPLVDSSLSGEFNWLDHTLQKLDKKSASTNKSSSQTEKMQKYFSADNKKIASLVRSAVDASQSTEYLSQDVASSPYRQDLNKIAINKTTTAFQNEDIFRQTGTKITYNNILERLKIFLKTTTTSTNAIVKFAKKVIHPRNTITAENNIMFDLDKKTLASQKFADILLSTKLKRQKLGFFGFLFHPFQTRRNRRTEELVKAFREIQHLSRTERNKEGNKGDSEQWQNTISKYLLYGNLLFNQNKGKVKNKKVEQKIEQLMSKQIHKLEKQYGILVHMQSNGLQPNAETTNPINKAIDKLMDACAQLKHEVDPENMSVSKNNI